MAFEFPASTYGGGFEKSILATSSGTYFGEGLLVDRFPPKFELEEFGDSFEFPPSKTMSPDASGDPFEDFDDDEVFEAVFEGGEVFEG